ncbi:MAG: AbrB/MazE/SpoVT family DNA-binding domain-containing protein [Bacillota bacterium]
MNSRQINEFRQIKVTSKRQITIPKSIFETFALKAGDSLIAYALDDGIFLKPNKEKLTVYDEDVKMIVKKAIDEGYEGDELAEEIAYRIKEYNDFFKAKVQEFEEDLIDDGVRDRAGVEDFNGLDIFFDAKAGADFKEL